MVGRRRGVRVRFADDPEPEDPWGPEDEYANAQPPTVHSQQQAAPQQSRLPQVSPQPIAARTVSRNSQPASEERSASPVPGRRSKPSRHVHQQPEQHTPQVPSLQKLCLGMLGRHVTQLVEQLDGQLGFLPPDAKAALLAVARRRGEVSSRVLSALADPKWTSLDLSGCEQLYAAEVVQAAPLMPNIRVLDVTGFEQLLSGGWKQFARACPSLSVIRLGGGQTYSQEALKALPHVLPGIAQPVAAAAAGTNSSSSSTLQASSSDQRPAAAAADPVEVEEVDNWEDAFASASEDDTDHNQNLNSNSKSINFVTTSSAGAMHADLAAQPTPPPAAAAAGGLDCRLKQLKALIWPDVPEEAVLLVQQRCPKVLINPPMKRDKVTGQYPPRELDGNVALDQPYMDMVADMALEGMRAPNQQQQQEHPDLPLLSLADKFRTAYIQQAVRLREKERRQLQQEKRRQLRSSHALRTLNAWLDEPA